jgi:hypothetical protein
MMQQLREEPEDNRYQLVNLARSTLKGKGWGKECI